MRIALPIAGLVFLALLALSPLSQAEGWGESNPLHLPEPGEHQLRILTPTVLELRLVTTKDPDPARPEQWDFIQADGELVLPAQEEFLVTAEGNEISVGEIGFKRRILYAPQQRRDLRIGSSLFLVLTQPLADGQTVEVKNPGGQLWDDSIHFSLRADPLRLSPVLHVNQVGYAPGFPKKAMAGFYLGSLGELDVPVNNGFEVLEAVSGERVFEGTFTARPDRGYLYESTPYQKVFEADFSELNIRGEYVLRAPGLGISYPFLIHEGSLAAFARSYALGLYQQRCGTAKSLPYTRHVHHVCHAAPAEVPTMDFAATQQFLAEASADYANNPRHTAPQLKDVDSSLYPFERQGLADVSGGHHDAGDYSKYTINSAQLIHYLVFAADNFAGAGNLDNLGWPESGDGRSDLLQAARWEADFLAKMQDTDGGFYFLVYPKNRRYEDNVLPDEGDPQVVWPKTTAVTAAAVAALAEIGSSPLFKRDFPESAALYLEKAWLGWEFLASAIAAHGQDGSYQKITHYGNEFMHDDELAWAAAAMFAATGDASFHDQLKAWFPDPADRNTHRWTWWRLFEGYGCAVRSYAFAVRSGRLPTGSLDPAYLAQCEAEVLTTADEQAGHAADHAYGSSFPHTYKAHRSAGWFFSSERAFDMTVAYQLEPKPEYLEAVLSNLNYEGGCNPLNQPFITGLGWPRQREIVHQHAQNDWQVLPPSGLPQGNIQAGFTWLHHYQGELSNLVYPPLNAATDPFPFYDRWADTFNTTTEFTVVDQARSLASLAFWMAASGFENQPWQAAPGQISGLPSEIPAGEQVTALFEVDGLDLEYALITWEARDQAPQFGAAFTFTPANMGEQWVEAEAQLPDGRRVFAHTTFAATTPPGYPPNSFQSMPVEPNEHTVALFHLDGDLADATGRNPDLALDGNAALNSSNLGWTTDRSGAALRVEDLGDRGLLSIAGPGVYSGSEDEITVEAMIFIEEWKAWQRSPAVILSLQNRWNAFLQLVEDPYKGLLVRGYGWEFSGQPLYDALPKNQWRHISISLKPDGYSFRVDGQTVAAQPGAGTEIELWNNTAPVQLELGNFQGWIDEVVVRNGPLPIAPAPGSGLARFVGADTSTQGYWKGVYGTEGYDIVAHSADYPASVEATPLNHDQLVWVQSSREIRALERVNGRWHFAGAWHAPEAFILNLNLTDGRPRRATFYFLDWESQTRSQRIDVLDAINGKVLDSRTVADFHYGQYLQWEIEGEVIFRFTGLYGTSPVLSGLFFDPVP